MGRPKNPRPAKLFIGMLSGDPDLFDLCKGILQKEYGPVDMETQVSRWAFTDYYASEMGSGLLRKFIFFERLCDPGALAGIKNFTNRLEQQTAISATVGMKRRINLDPGYLTEAKVVLATTKDFSHRIYIGDNIYAEVTLRYRAGSFEPMEYTYPDYRSEEYIRLFNNAREVLRKAIRPAEEGYS